MSKTNYQKSNLSTSLHAYDLVVAVTAKAINRTMKRFLDKMGEAQTVELWYCKKGRHDPLEQMDPVALPGNKDIFSLTNDDEVPQALSTAKFKFAIRAQFGLPEGVPKRRLKDIIQLSQDRQKVHFNLFFKHFEIIERKFDDFGPYLNKVSQEDGDPIFFETMVDMNFDKMDPESKFYKDMMDDATKDRLMNLNTSTMFSVQQLYLDLNTAALQNTPTISGLDRDSDALATIAQKDFINTCWTAFSDSSAVVLGYAVKAIETEEHSSIQPTDLTFNVSPYYNDDGSKSDKFDLYTLNYVMNTDKQRRLKLGAPFEWNWVQESESKTHSGAMAVRREVFANFLAKALLAPDTGQHYLLSNLCIVPSLSVGGTIVTWNSSATFSPDPNPLASNPVSYVRADGKEVLTFSYSKSVETNKKIGDVFDTDDGGNWFDDALNVAQGFVNKLSDPLFADKSFALTSRSHLSVELENDIITIKVTGDMYIDDFDPGDAFDIGNIAGYLGGFSKDIKLQITTAGNGKLTVKQQDTSDPTIKDANLDENIAAGLDGSTDMADNLRIKYLKYATSWVDQFATEIENYLNESGNMWVFPGGNTFTFQDARFSEHQDLITHISYANPNR